MSSDVDFGPLVGLAHAIQEGSIGPDAAKEAAAGYGRRGEVTPQQLAGLAAACLGVAERGEWRRALPLAELGYEAAAAAHEAHPQDAAFAEIWLYVSADLIEVLHWALMEKGDIRLFLRAQQIGETGIEAAERLGFPRMQGLLALRLGTLVLDCYTANRTPSNYEGQFDAWVTRALQDNDPELIWLVSQPAVSDAADSDRPPPTWPASLDALDSAERLLRAALPLVVPERRGRTLKAIVQVLEWRGLLGGTSDPDAIRQVAQQALDELPPDDAQPRLAVMGTLERLGVTPAGDELMRRIEYDWAGFRAETTEDSAWDAIGQAASLLQDSDPRRALALFRRRRELTGPWADESQRARYFENELILFWRAFSPKGFNPWDSDLDASAEQARTIAGAATSPAAAREAAAAILAVMMASTASDREALGLTLAQQLFALDQSLWSKEVDAATFLVAALFRGEGVNNMRANDVDAAARHYCRAAEVYRDLEMPSVMVQCLDYIDDAVRAGATDLNELTAWLAAESLGFEMAAPTSAPPVLHSLGAHILAAQVSTGTSAVAVQYLLQVLKGRRFAAMLAAGTKDFELDEETRYLLSREAEEEAALPPGSDVLRPTPFDAGMGDDDMLCAWVDEFETGPSDTPEDRIANIQRTIERRLTASLVPESYPQMPGLEDIQARLDDHTALLEIYEGPWADGSIAVWQVLITHDDIDAAAGKEQMPYGTVLASWRGRSVSMPESGFYVGALRRAVQAAPGPLDVSPEGADLLTRAAERYTRVVNDNKEELAGISRLVVVPHASSRYVPIHLVGPPGKPLADRFTVTYLSNIGQLTTPPAPGPRREGVAVFGLSYQDQPHLPRLDDSADETTAIAKVCGTTPLLDTNATEAAFIRALETARFVHLRAHGRLYVDAPSFHTVFLHPGNGDDGRLRAYEILPLDLTGLELVTLGACETALGRVDRSDNPRGLPAALLLAGARSVIGTLWPVLAGASTFFFTQLYRSLVGEDVDVTTAFAAAQQATRREFPQYRDWGAFYLIGGLS